MKVTYFDSDFNEVPREKATWAIIDTTDEPIMFSATIPYDPKMGPLEEETSE